MSLKRPVQRPHGFSLAELAVVMLLTTLITGILVVFYSQSRLALERGASKTELSQRTRMAAIRIIPKLTSVVARPPNTAEPLGVRPIVSPTPPADPYTDPGATEIHLNTTKEFIKTQLRVPSTAADEFNPRGTPIDEHGELFLRFVITGTNAQLADIAQRQGLSPQLAQVGELRMNAVGADAVASDIIVAKNLAFVRFSVQSNSRIRLRVGARGSIKNATSGFSIDENIYETDVYLPVYTDGTD